MATSRYDLRKTYEEAEANAIGTEYVRLDFLPPARAEDARGLLRAYLDQRIAFYTVDDPNRLQQIDADTVELQAKLWSVAQRLVAGEPTPVSTLLASGMNDVLNSQSYTQAGVCFPRRRSGARAAPTPVRKSGLRPRQRARSPSFPPRPAAKT